MKKSKRLLRIFVGNYLFVVITLLCTLAIFLFGVIFNLAKDYDKAIKSFEKHQISQTDFKTLNEEKILKSKGWIEIVENGKIIKVIGKKKDDIKNYSLENVINNPSDWQGYESRAFKKNGKLFVVKMPLEDESIENSLINIKKYALNSGITALIFFAIVSSISTYFSIRGVSKPLKKIKMGIKEMSKGNYDVKLDFHTYKEIEDIKNSFNYMVSQLKNAQEEKRKSEDSKKKMIRDISHDIKTPITSILGYSKALMDGIIKDEKDQKLYLKYIYDKTNRLNLLVEDLFVFSKMDSPNYQLQRKPINIAEFVREIGDFYYPDAEDKNFDIQVKIESENVFALIDIKEMQRAIGNLVMNALKYNPEGTILKIVAKQDSNNAIISIIDNGVGISKQVQEDIFTEFVRGDYSRKSSGGSGLGLAITKRIVEFHEGKIILKSKEFEGTSFDVYLPLI